LIDVIGKRLLSLQWAGSLTFEDLAIEECDERAVIVSRLGENDLRKVVLRMERRLGESGYCHDIELTKYDTVPHFRFTYLIELLDDDSTDEVSSAGELCDSEDSDDDSWQPDARSDSTAETDENKSVDLLGGWDD